MSFRRQHIRNTRAVLEEGTPLIGEYPYDTDLKTIRAGDGATLGGLLLKLWGKSYTLAPAQIAADQNDYNPADLKIAEAMLLDLSANWSMTGLAGGATNREIAVYNGSTFRLTLKNEDATSAAANRFHIGSDIVLRPYQGVRLVYSAALARWLVIGRMDIGITDLPEGLTLSGECRPAQLTADVNDWDPADAGSALAWSKNRATAIYVNTDAARNITGLAGGAKGRFVVISNNGANSAVLKNASAASLAANRFDMSTDITLASKQCAILEYDALASRWKLLASTAGAAVADGAVTAPKLASSGIGGAIVNGKLVYSVAGNALTVALKTLADNDPSAADPVWVRVRDANAGTDADDWMKITAALSMTLSNGSSCGSVNGTPFRLWAVLFNDAGTPRIGLVNTLSGLSVMPLSAWAIANSTAEGAAGAADNSQVFYTAVAVAAKPYALLGYATWEAGLAAAGTWSAVPTRVQMFGLGVPLPGQNIQSIPSANNVMTTTTATIPADDTIPQNTEGVQVLSVSIEPSSAANLLHVRSMVNVGGSTAFRTVNALFRDALADAVAANEATIPGASFELIVPTELWTLAGSSAPTTFKSRTGPNGAATMTINGSNSARLYGGVLTSQINVTEYMT